MICVRPISIYALFAAALVGAPAARATGLTTPTQSPPHAIENPAAATSLDQLAATRERPLFAPDRRRPTAASVVSHVEPPPPPPDEPRLSLFGVVVDTDGPRAVIRSDPAGKTVRVRLGDEVGGWRVTQIEGQQLVMSLGDRSETVMMFKSYHGGKQVARVHPLDRVLEVNAAGVLRSHRVHVDH
ncbi:MAG: hypothetical protein ACLQLT_10405 [Methylovirgula sp.]